MRPWAPSSRSARSLEMMDSAASVLPCGRTYPWKRRSNRRAPLGLTGPCSPASQSRSPRTGSARKCATPWRSGRIISRRKGSRVGKVRRARYSRAIFSMSCVGGRLTRCQPSCRPKLDCRASGSAEGEHVAGVYRQRVQLASGRFAMIDNGLGFELVPWKPALEEHAWVGTSRASCSPAARWRGASAGRVDWELASSLA